MKLPRFICTAFLIAFIAATAQAQEERQFEQYNFAITPPPGLVLETDNSMPAGTVALFRNADKTRAIVVVVSERNLPGVYMDDRFVEDFENGVQKHGAQKFISGKFVQVDGIKGYERVGLTTRNGVSISMVWDVVLIKGRTYIIEALFAGGGDANTDVELRRSLGSFRFITPPETLPESPHDRPGYMFGYRSGQAFGYIIVAAIIQWLLQALT